MFGTMSFNLCNFCKKFFLNYNIFFTYDIDYSNDLNLNYSLEIDYIRIQDKPRTYFAFLIYLFRNHI